MICNLCLKEVELCNSHILPEFLYKDIYEEEGHIYFTFSTDISERIEKRRKGIYEKLLCRQCESIIGRYEDYAAKVIYGGTPIDVFLSNEIVISNLDYTKFKLFQISLLWRAGVSMRDEFRNVYLDKHSEIMRNMLLKGIPGEAYEYGCILIFVPQVKDFIHKMIFPFEQTPTKILGHTCYRAIFGGLFWIYFVSSHMKHFPYQEKFLNKSGELKILKDGQYAIEFLKLLGQDIANKKKDFL